MSSDAYMHTTILEISDFRVYINRIFAQTENNVTSASKSKANRVQQIHDVRLYGTTYMLTARGIRIHNQRRVYFTYRAPIHWYANIYI